VTLLHRLIPVVAALAAIGVLRWAGLPAPAVLVALVGGPAGLAYLVMRTRRPMDEHEQDQQGRALRDLPPPPTGQRRSSYAESRARAARTSLMKVW
jgi:hypothetical protein